MRKSHITAAVITAAASVAASVAYEFYVRPWLAQRMNQSTGGTEA